MLKVVDRVHFHLVLLVYEAPVGVGRKEHVQHVLQGEKPGEDFLTDSERVYKVVVTPVVDLNKTEPLSVYVKVELSFEIHGDDVHVSVCEAFAEFEENVVVGNLDVLSGHG